MDQTLEDGVFESIRAKSSMELYRAHTSASNLADELLVLSELVQDVKCGNDAYAPQSIIIIKDSDGEPRRHELPGSVQRHNTAKFYLELVEVIDRQIELVDAAVANALRDHTTD